MPAALELKGTAASPGTYTGPIHRAPAPTPHPDKRHVGGDDWNSLTSAIDQSVQALRYLMQRSGAEGADILDFQVEMLLDPAIAEPARNRIADGTGAALAWAAAMDDYIAGFEQSDEEQVRARAVDVIDLKTRVLDALRGSHRPDFPAGCVYLADDMTPSQFLEHNWKAGGGIVLMNGSRSSHVALLARSQAVPMVVGLDVAISRDAISIRVDGTTGSVIVNPDSSEAALKSHPLVDNRPYLGETGTKDGTPVELFVNISDLMELHALDPSQCAGIGLFRTEFTLRTPADIADENLQYRTYRSLLEWAGSKPVTVRLLDIGADKAVTGLSPEESNPSLGLRGIRLLLSNPDILRIQARALLRAAVHGDLKVMLPMVTVPFELDQTLAIFAQEAAGLARREIPHDLPPIGMMVEVPAAAMTLDQFTAAAFLSIGSNDLSQYLMAAGRDNVLVADLYAAAGPVLFQITRQIVATAAAMALPVSLCGDGAADDTLLAGWLAAGIRQFSVSPGQLQGLKAALLHHDIGQTKTMDA